MALSIGTLVGYLSLDDTNFNRKADAADRKINALKLHLDALKASNPKISVEVETQTKSLDALKAKIADLKEQAARGVDVRVEMTQAMIDLDRVQAKLRELHNKTIRVDVDTTAANAKLDALQAKIRGTGGPSWMTTGILGFGPTVLPMLGAAVGAMTALGSGAVAAAGGVGVLKLAYSGLSKELQAYNKYQIAIDTATTKAQRKSAQHALAASAFGQAGAPAQHFTEFLFNKGEPAFNKLKGTAQNAVFPGSTKALRELITILPTADRLVSRLGHTMGQMEVDAAHALTDPFWQHFFNWLGKTAQTDLPLIGSAFGHTFEGIARMIERFTPQGTSILTWLDAMATKFDQWTAGGKGSGFEHFMKSVSQDGNAVVGVLRPLVPILKNLGSGLNSGGLTELKGFGWGLAQIAKIPPGPFKLLAEAIGPFFLALKGAALARGGAAALVGIAGTLSKIKGLGALGRFRFPSLGGVVAGEAGSIGLGKGVVPVYVTNSGFGGPGGGGDVVGGAGKGGLLDRFLGAGAGGAAALGGTAAALGGVFFALDKIVQQGTKWQPQSLKVPWTNQIQQHQGFAVPGSAADIKNFQMGGTTDPAKLKAWSDQLQKLINIAHHLVPSAGSAQTAVDGLDKQVATLVSTGNTKGFAALAKVAADSGLSMKHLLAMLPDTTAALKAAGGGSLQLGLALSKLPKNVQTAIETPGMVTSMSDVKALAKQYDLTPKQVRTVVNLLGGAAAISALAAIQARMDALHSKDVTVRVNEIHAISYGPGAKASAPSGVMGATGKPSADGSTVPKGGAYKDRYPYLLAPGEEVISNRNGQADRFRPLLKAINAGHLANGGTAGKKLTPAQKRHAALSKRAAALAKQLQRAQSVLGHTNTLIGNANAFGDAFGGNVFAAGLPTTQDVTVPGHTFTTTINGQQVTESTAATTKTVDLSSAQILKEMLGYQKGQRTQAVGLLADIKKLRKEGVSQSLLNQMQAGGAQGVAEIHALASGSKAQVQTFNSLNAQTNTALQQAGAYGTGNQSMTQLQRQKSNEEAQIRAIRKALHGVSVSLKHNHLRVN